MQAKVESFSGEQFYQESPRIPHPDTPGHSCYVAARASIDIRFWGRYCSLYFGCNSQPKLQLLMMSMPMLLRQRKNSLRAEASNFGSRRISRFRRWTPSGSRSRLCLGASGLPLA